MSDQLPCFMGDPIDLTPPERLGAGGTALARPVEVVAIASIHKIESLCRRALRCSHYWGVVEVGAQAMTHKNKDDPRALHSGWRPSCLGDLDDILLAHLPISSIRKFSALYAKVLTHAGYFWLKAGDDFKVRFV